MTDDTIIEPVSEAQKRITQLSDKVRLTSEERDEQKRLLGEESTKRLAAEKERDFYAGFSDVVSIHPQAKEHKDEIKAKVLAGYTAEDAAFAVLGKAGKLGNAPVEQQQVAGGSAVTTPPQKTDKSPSEMTLAEKREQLSKDLIWQ